MPRTLPTSLRFELGSTARQALWRACCQSIDEHRFDCTEVGPEKRGRGPFGPTTGPTVAQAIAAMRTRLVVDEPTAGVLRVREVPS